MRKFVNLKTGEVIFVSDADYELAEILIKEYPYKELFENTVN